MAPSLDLVRSNVLVEPALPLATFHLTALKGRGYNRFMVEDSERAEPDNSEALLEELDLGPGPALPRAKTTLHVEYVRDLTEADMAALAAPRGARPKSLVRIHSSHHSVARCLAAGMKPSQVALVTGYTTVRVRQLETDPAFMALVEDYRAESRSVFADMAQRMGDLSLDALELLHERLHESPESFTVQTLLEVVKTFADRTGYGPNQQVNIKMSNDLIDRPPRESYEDWQKRRTLELLPAPSDKVN